MNSGAAEGQAVPVPLMAEQKTCEYISLFALIHVYTRTINYIAVARNTQFSGF